MMPCRIHNACCEGSEDVVMETASADSQDNENSVRTDAGQMKEQHDVHESSRETEGGHSSSMPRKCTNSANNDQHAAVCTIPMQLLLDHLIQNSYKGDTVDQNNTQLPK